MNTKNKWLQIISACVFLMPLVSCSFGGVGDTLLPQKAWRQEDLEQVVESWRSQSNIPGVVVGLSFSNRPEILIASGESNMQEHITLKPTDQFQIASISKTFIAARVLQLAAGGKLELDASINDYLTGIPNGDVVTIRYLLNHRSGYFDPIYDDPTFIPYVAQDLGREWTADEVLALAFQREPFFAPGTSYQYSNTNYLLLGLIIEAVTRQTLEEELTSNLIAPLQLDHTMYRTIHTDVRDSDLAHGYDITYLGESGKFVDTMNVPSAAIFSISNNTIFSNASDLIVWARALYGNNSTLLESRYKKQMLTFGSLSSYGLGVEQFNTPIGISIGHDGSSPGYLSQLEYFPDEDIVIVILVNANAPSVSTTRLRDLLLAAIFDFNNSQEGPPSIGDQEVQALIDKLESKDPSVRKEAISALGHSGSTSPEAIQGLIKILREDVNPENRKEAALALGIVGKDSDLAKQALTEALNDPDASVREAAQLALNIMK